MKTLNSKIGNITVNQLIIALTIICLISASLLLIKDKFASVYFLSAGIALISLKFYLLKK